MSKVNRLTSEYTDLSRFFTGHDDLRLAFEKFINQDEQVKHIFILYGVGGIGKSSLMEMFFLYCKHHEILAALATGDDVKSPIDLIHRWILGLADGGIYLKNSLKELNHYRAIQNKVESATRKQQKSTKDVGKVATKALVEAAVSSIPVVGPFASLFGSGGEAAAGWLFDTLSKPELDTLRSPTENLTEVFLKDLERTVKKRKLILFLDTFEKITFQEDWLGSLASHFPQGVYLVFAGRNRPDLSPSWPGWMRKAQFHEVTPLSDEDIRILAQRYYQFIQSGKLTDRQVDEIVRFAHGLPLAVTNAISLWLQCGFQEFRDVRTEALPGLLERMRRGMPEELYPAFEAASITRLMNKEILRAVSEIPVSDQAYETLRRLPFMRPRGDFLMVHDAVREFVEAYVRQSDPEKHQQLHHRAHGYYLNRIQSTLPQLANPLKFEVLYHALREDEQVGVQFLESFYYEARLAGMTDFQQGLLAEASTFTFSNVQNEYLCEFLEGDFVEGWKAREKHYRALLEKELTIPLKIKVLRSLADPLAYQGKSKEAEEKLTECLGLCDAIGDQEHEAWTRLELCWQIDDLGVSQSHIDRALEIFKNLDHKLGIAVANTQSGWNWLNLWQAEKARDAFLPAKLIQKELGNRQSVAVIEERIGQTYLIEGFLKPAIEHKEHALAIFEELQDEWNIAWTLDELATCYIPAGRLAQALTVLDRAETIFAKWQGKREADSIIRKGTVFYQQGRMNLAEKTYLHASQAEKYSTWGKVDLLVGQGYLRLEAGKFEDALLHFQAIEALFAGSDTSEGIAVSALHQAQVYLAQQDWKKAIDLLNKAQLAAQKIQNRAFECQACLGLFLGYAEIGQYEKALEFAEAGKQLALRYSFYQHLAKLHLFLGHLAWDGVLLDATKYKSATDLYQKALIFALRHNSYLLDSLFEDGKNWEPATSLVKFCLIKGQEGLRMLSALRDWWQQGVNVVDDRIENDLSLIPAGISLVLAEQAARKRDTVEGIIQKSLVERFNEIVK